MKAYGYYCDKHRGFLHDSASAALGGIEERKGFAAHTLEVEECVPEEDFPYTHADEAKPTVGDILHCEEVGKVRVLAILSQDIPQN